jgi:GntR family transcriptional regulator, rspAB operon transcriptional repressor
MIIRVASDSRLMGSPVVTDVFEKLLAAVHRGDLVPGQRISDAELAEQFGVSRTPVREALQRLREIGVIEASASRFTRVADVTPIQTAQALVVWIALYAALLEEVVPVASAGAADAAASDHAAFVESLATSDPQDLARTNFVFFNRLTDESTNPALRRAITSVVHVIRLGSQHLPHYIDIEAVSRAQALIVTALRDRDLAVAHEALAELQRIEVPLQ